MRLEGSVDKGRDRGMTEFDFPCSETFRRYEAWQNGEETSPYFPEKFVAPQSENGKTIIIQKIFVKEKKRAKY